MTVRLLLAALVGAVVAIATLYAALWIVTLQATVTTAAVEAQRARIAAEHVAGALATTRAPQALRQPVQPMRRGY